MNDNTLQYLPFHAINEFMRPDFRHAVVAEVLQNQANLSDHLRSSLIRLTKKLISIPGFRNSGSAPASVRVKPTIATFEKNPELAGIILAGWVELHAELRQQVFDFLKARDWEVLPPEADRTKLPGFLPDWPKGEDFETLNSSYLEAYPQGDSDPDHISLMAVWLGGRLPYNQEDNPEEAAA